MKWNKLDLALMSEIVEILEVWDSLSFVVDGPNVLFYNTTKHSRYQTPLFDRWIQLHNLLTPYSSSVLIFIPRYFCHNFGQHPVFQELLTQPYIQVIPSQSDEDLFLLEYAVTNHAFIISNDRFKDYQHLYPMITKRRRVPFSIVDQTGSTTFLIPILTFIRSVL